MRGALFLLIERILVGSVDLTVRRQAFSARSERNVKFFLTSAAGGVTMARAV
jgi:hypothetical protein